MGLHQKEKHLMLEWTMCTSPNILSLMNTKKKKKKHKNTLKHKEKTLKKENTQTHEEERIKNASVLSMLEWTMCTSPNILSLMNTKKIKTQKHLKTQRKNFKKR